MNDSYNRMKKLSEQDDKYSTAVDVEIYIDDHGSYAESSKVTIPFNIDVEHRSWGIKGIDISVYGEITVPYIETDEEGNETDKEMKVDLSKIKTEWVEGKSYAPSQLSIHVDANGNVNYDKSYLELEYLVP